jgi:UDP-N-acetylmuramoyl-tripeptide--D-alanyl-D-alanine ligase
MAELELRHIYLALGGRPTAEAEGQSPGILDAVVRSVVVDSRQVEPGSVFVALRGEQTDGHLYVRDAFARGAIGAIVEKEPSCSSVIDLRATGKSGRGGASLSLPLCFCVEDSLAALQQAAARWRARFPARVIGITGSVGKTTTKELIAAVLAQRYRVLKSQGNYNNEIGLPLTLLQLDDSHERVVLEMGTYGPGEISLLAEIARPQVGIVTNVGPVHLERMGTIERIAQAKSELPAALPVDGVAILNADDARVRAMAQQTPARVFLYGLAPDSDLWADGVQTRGLRGIRFRFHRRTSGGQEEVIDAHLPLLGSHNVYTALRAAAAGLVEGLSWDEILRGLRIGEQLRLAAVPGVNGSTLLDDTYNSSPDSAIAALDLLGEMDGRKVAVLGDMLELGAYEVEGHRQVARRAIEVVSLLITVGRLGRLIGEAALEFGMPSERVVHVQDNAGAIACLQERVREGDAVLIKGSRGMAMEQIVEALARPSANDAPGGGVAQSDGPAGGGKG